MFQVTHEQHGLLPINVDPIKVCEWDDERIVKSISTYRSMRDGGFFEPDANAMDNPSAGYLRLLEAIATDRGL